MKRKTNGHIKKDYMGMRDLACQVAAYATSIALQRTYGYGADRQNALSAAILDIQNRYGAVILQFGPHEAVKYIYEKAKSYGIDPVVRWPDEPDRPKPNARGWQEYLEDRKQMEEGASIGWCYYAIALHEEYGFGRKRFEVLHDRVEDIIKGYTEDQATCEYASPEERRKRHANKDFAFKVLTDAAARLFKQDCSIIDDEDDEMVRKCADETAGRIAQGALKIMRDEQKKRLDDLRSSGKFDGFVVTEFNAMMTTNNLIRKWTK